MTIWDRTKEFLDSHHSSSTENRKRYVADAMAEFIMFLNGREMIREMLSEYPGWLARHKGNSVSTIQKKVNVVCSFFRWCWKMDYTAKPWHEYFPNIKCPAYPLPDIIQHSEYLALRKACFSVEEEWIIILAYHTGLRLIDCCAMRWDNIDRKRQIITSTPSKTRNSTAVEVSIPYVSGGDLHKFITEMYELPDRDELVAPNIWAAYRNGRSAVVMRFDRIFARAGVVGKSFKHFRSTFESRMANSGMNIGLAAKLTGRTGTRSIMRYIKPDMDVAREGIARAMSLHETVEGFK